MSAEAAEAEASPGSSFPRKREPNGLPGERNTRQEGDWIPAFAGMTAERMTTEDGIPRRDRCTPGGRA